MQPVKPPTIQEAQESESSLDHDPSPLHSDKCKETREVTLVFIVQNIFLVQSTQTFLGRPILCTEPLEPGMCRVPCWLGCVVYVLVGPWEKEEEAALS